MSEYNPPGKPDQFESPAAEGAPQPRQMSGCVKAIIVLLILGAVSVAVCCGGGYLWIINSFTEDPVKVQAISDKIVQIDIPANWEPRGAVDVSVFNIAFRIAMYATSGDRGFMMLMDVDASLLQGQSIDSLREQVQTSFSSQMNTQPGADLKILESGDREVTIRGEQTKVIFNKCETRDSHQVVWQVTATFQGNERPAIVFLEVAESVMSADQIVQMLQSIQ